MWSCVAEPTSCPWLPNHFVPLVAVKTTPAAVIVVNDSSTEAPLAGGGNDTDGQDQQNTNTMTRKTTLPSLMLPCCPKVHEVKSVAHQQEPIFSAMPTSCGCSQRMLQVGMAYLTVSKRTPTLLSTTVKHIQACP